MQTHLAHLPNLAGRSLALLIFIAAMLATTTAAPAQTTRTRIAQTLDITTSVLTGVHVYESDYYDSDKVPGSGAAWVSTGNTDALKAGTFDRASGLIYDANGNEFEYAEPRIELDKLGAARSPTDSYAAQQDIFDYAAGRPVHAAPGASYTTGELITGTDIYAKNNGATFVMKKTAGGSNHTIYSASDNLKVEGGKYLGYEAHLISLEPTADMNRVELVEMEGDGGGTAQDMILIKDGARVQTLILRRNYCHDYTKAGFDLRLRGGVGTNEVWIQDNIIENITNNVGGTTQAIKVGDESYLRAGVCVISGNVIKNIYNTNSSLNSEAKGIICFGRNPKIHGNFIYNVYNDYGDDAEGIYTKCMWGQIYGNTLHNAGSSHDGCIQIKGGTELTTLPNDPDAGTHTLVFGNTVILSSDAYDAPAIKCDKSNSQVYGNNVYDLRGTRGSMNYSIGIAFSDSEVGDYIQVFGNNITGFRYGILSGMSGNFNQVFNNTVRKCVTYGIQVRTADDVTIDSVDILDNVVDGDGVVITEGIRVQSGGTGRIRKLTVRGNTISDTGKGIRIMHNGYASLDFLNIQQNTYLSTSIANTLAGMITELTDGLNKYDSSVTNEYDVGGASITSAQQVELVSFTP